MSFTATGPRSFVVTFATVVAVLMLGLQSSTQSQGTRAQRLTRINGFEAVEGEVLLKYRDEAAVSAHSRVESQADAETVERLTPRGVRRLRSRGLRTAQLLTSLRNDPQVEYVEPNYIRYAVATPNDPSFTSLWGLFNSGFNPIGGGGAAGADIDSPAAWDTTTGSRANVVGVIDSGIDYNHPDLAANIWAAPVAFQVTISGQTITCQAGTHGFNAITRTCDPMDDNSHGTHVAGTIGAVGNNGTGIAGVNWTASMMGLKFLGASGSGSTSDAIAAIEFAIQTKARFTGSSVGNVRVLSNSWGGGGYSAALANAINAANAADMLFVAAAGNSAVNNDTYPHYPSSYATANMVSVASSTSADTRSGFSNYGATSVHLAAPGSAILSTTPNNTYSTFQGTSMAAPHVSGAAALALAMCGVNTAQLKTLLLDSVDLVPAFSGLTITGGRLNVGAMIRDCPYPKVSNVALSSSLPSPQVLGATVTWTAVASGGQGPYEYEWAVYDGTAWTTVRPWQAGNTYAWTPTTANLSYQIAGRARSAWNTGTRDAAGTQAFQIASSVVTSLSLTPNVASPQGVGTTVTWSAAAGGGGQTPYQYQWAVSDGVTWTTMTGWSPANTWAWTPTSANLGYAVAVRARSAWNTGAREMATTQVYGVLPKVTSVTMTPDAPAPRALGATVTWTAGASGGTAPYEYQWAVFDGAAWTTMTGWSSANTWAWTPVSANASYQVAARARSAWNTGIRDLAATQAYAVVPGVVSSLLLSPNLASPRAPNTAITWTGTASGGQAPYQYQWAVYNGVAWTTMTDWSTSHTWTWTPTAANASYQVAVRARSAWNTGNREMATVGTYVIQ